ncbi:MAG: PHP domain-containing protein [Limnochordia bacterium]|nr:PHP domain-containing protein [Limnochordia bacterium]
MSYLVVADLHIHTNASDGTYTPEEIVQKAWEQGFSTIAITDHDAIDNVFPTMQEGERLQVNVISGVELSTELGQGEIHILGYCFSPADPFLLSALDQLRLSRMRRVTRTVELLQQMGMCLDLNDVLAVAEGAAVGRAHVARVLMARGYTSSIAEGFARFLGQGKPAYVSRARCHTLEAIDLIINAGGVPVLAHPGLSPAGLKYLPTLVDAGLAGLEVFYPQHSKEQEETFMQIAEDYDLLVTGGSDCHGAGKDQIYFGSVRLPDYYIRALMMRAADLQTN